MPPLRLSIFHDPYISLSMGDLFFSVKNDIEESMIMPIIQASQNPPITLIRVSATSQRVSSFHFSLYLYDISMRNPPIIRNIHHHQNP